MAHAGTMVGGSAQTKQSGRPWPAIALAVAVVVATVAGVWLASSASLVAAPPSRLPIGRMTRSRPSAAHSCRRAIAAWPMTSISMASSTGAHAAPYVAAVTLSSHDIRALNAHLNAILDGAHATPYAGDAPGLPFSATSGTFHPGKPADQPATRDRVGGP